MAATPPNRIIRVGVKKLELVVNGLRTCENGLGNVNPNIFILSSSSSSSKKLGVDELRYPRPVDVSLLRDLRFLLLLVARGAIMKTTSHSLPVDRVCNDGPTTGVSRRLSATDSAQKDRRLGSAAFAFAKNIVVLGLILLLAAE